MRSQYEIMANQSDESIHPMYILIVIIFTVIHMRWMEDTGRTYDIWRNVYVDGEFSAVETMLYGGY